MTYCGFSSPLTRQAAASSTYFVNNVYLRDWSSLPWTLDLGPWTLSWLLAKSHERSVEMEYLPRRSVVSLYMLSNYYYYYYYSYLQGIKKKAVLKAALVVSGAYLVHVWWCLEHVCHPFSLIVTHCCPLSPIVTQFLPNFRVDWKWNSGLIQGNFVKVKEIRQLQWSWIFLQKLPR